MNLDLSVVAIFVLAVAAGSWVQHTCGFALGIVALAILQLSGVLPIESAAAVISVLAFCSVVLSLRGHVAEVDRRLFLGLVAGHIPAIVFGVWLLMFLSREFAVILELIFGLFLIAGSGSLALQPKPLARRTPTAGIFCVGLAGGVLGGLFSASGPVSGWFGYLQPLGLSAIRASLLAMLLVTSLTRTIVVAVRGEYSTDLLVLIAVGIPVVVLMTQLSRRFPLGLGEIGLRRFVFSLLTITGLWIAGSAIYQLYDG